jgi:hypothetical protein
LVGRGGKKRREGREMGRGEKTGKGGRWAGPRGEKLDRFVSFFFFKSFLTHLFNTF